MVEVSFACQFNIYRSEEDDEEDEMEGTGGREMFVNMSDHQVRRGVTTSDAKHLQEMICE